jgi:hypothetical protein
MIQKQSGMEMQKIKQSDNSLRLQQPKVHHRVQNSQHVFPI